MVLDATAWEKPQGSRNQTSLQELVHWSQTERASAAGVAEDMIRHLPAKPVMAQARLERDSANIGTGLVELSSSRKMKFFLDLSAVAEASTAMTDRPPSQQVDQILSKRGGGTPIERVSPLRGNDSNAMNPLQPKGESAVPIWPSRIPSINNRGQPSAPVLQAMNMLQSSDKGGLVQTPRGGKPGAVTPDLQEGRSSAYEVNLSARVLDNATSLGLNKGKSMLALRKLTDDPLL